MNRKIRFALFPVTLMSPIGTVNAAPIQLGDYLLPSAFSASLEQGMHIPVFIRYKNDSSKNNKKIADALVMLKGTELEISSVELTQLPNNTELSAETKELINRIKSKKLKNGTIIDVSSDAKLELNTKSFNLELIVGKEALAAAIIPRSLLLGASSVEGVSNVLDYNIGSYYSNYKNNNSSRSYISLDNFLAWKEHHINVNGTIYSAGSGETSANLYRAMYERDYKGNRLAFGRVDTWNLQSIASINALNSSRIYGVTYGNKASTVMENTSLSLTPITVFLPAAGEVHIMREGRLLSIQNFPMGSFEVDTSRLPYGIYEVDIEILVAGKVVNSLKSRVNEIFSNKKSSSGEIAWQIFGGSLEYSKTSYERRHYANYENKNTSLIGGATAITLPLLSGLALKSTGYQFDNNVVSETEANLVANEHISITAQNLTANDNSQRNIGSVNINIPGGYGSLWVSREKGLIGKRLPLQNSDNRSVGGMISINKFIPHGGIMSISHVENKHAKNTYKTIDYSTALLSGKYGTLGLRAGIQRYYYNEKDRNGVQERYFGLDFSLPLANWLSVGVSDERGGARLGTVSLRKSINDSNITSVGLSASQRLNNTDTSGSKQMFSGSVGYDTQYSAGTLSATKSNDSNNFSLSSHGAIGWNSNGVGLSKDKQPAGVIVKTNLKGDGALTAKVNNKQYKLTNGSNFIALPAYSYYTIELENDKNSEDTFDIVTDRKSTYTLYPGNVGYLTPEIKNMVTVFGRIRMPSGEPARNIAIHNHIGKTTTNNAGDFSMDIDKQYPVIALATDNGSICEADLNLNDAKGAIWVGDISCNEQKQMASR